MADVGKKGWNDLTTMFNQKASLYSDPNAQTGSNHDYTGMEGQSYQQAYSNSNYNLSSSNSFSSKETSSLLNSSKCSDQNDPSLVTSSLGKTGLSKEESTLINFGNKSSKKSNAKTKEDDFWDILNESAKRN